MVRWRRRSPCARRSRRWQRSAEPYRRGARFRTIIYSRRAKTRARSALSELFAGKPTLIAHSFSYGLKMDHACPNCTSILDALDGKARHLTQRASLVVIAKSPFARRIR
jgi:predicted dithiol-disulfide oxidoreductase (DUF899 family)